MRVYCGKLTVFFFPALILMGCAISPGADPAGMYPLDDFPESFCPESSIEKLHRPDPGRMVPLDDFEEFLTASLQVAFATCPTTGIRHSGSFFMILHNSVTCHAFESCYR